MISKERAKELFKYKDGQLYWKNPPRNKPIDGPAGRTNSKGYRQVRVDGSYHMEHHVIAAMHGKEIPKGMVIDHKDRQRSNNKNGNLKVSSHSDNNKNRVLPKKSAK